MDSTLLLKIWMTFYPNFSLYFLIFFIILATIDAILFKKCVCVCLFVFSMYGYDYNFTLSFIHSGEKKGIYSISYYF